MPRSSSSPICLLRPETNRVARPLQLKKTNMKKGKNNIWLTIGVILICGLLLFWLIARTIIVEDEEFETTNVPALIQQSPGE